MDNTSSQPVELLSDEAPATSSSSEALSPTLRPSKSKERRSYKCDTCDYKSDRLRNLKRHNKKPCKGSKSVKRLLRRCELCDYKTRWSSDLKRHIKKVHAPVWKCDYCNFTTEVSREFLQDHHQQVHQGLPFYDKAKSLRVGGEQPRLMVEEASNTLESVLEAVDPEHHPIYRVNWDAIRTDSFEPKNSDNKFINHAYYRIRHTPSTDWSTEVEKIFQRQAKRFKLNYAHSLILYNRSNEAYRFWHASRGTDRVLEKPINVFSRDDLDRVLRLVNTHDMWRWASNRKSSSVWTVAAITSTTFFVDRLEFSMGMPAGGSKHTLEAGQDTVQYEKYKTFEDDSESDFSDFDEMLT